MSCPYLERGRIPLCRAVGKRGMELSPGRMEADCFSGDFTRCPLLLLFPPIQERKSWRPALSTKRHSEKEGGPDGWRKGAPVL